MTDKWNGLDDNPPELTTLEQRDADRESLLQTQAVLADIGCKTIVEAIQRGLTRVGGLHE